MPRSTSSLPGAQKLEIAQRIVDLRERSPFGQPKMAARLEIGLRAYQKLEAKGTTKFERCEELAEIHAEWAKDDPEWAFVSANWIWSGHRTPRLMETFNGEVTQLDRIEAKLDRLLVATEQPAASGVPQPPGQLGRDATSSPPTAEHPEQQPKKPGRDKRTDTG